MAASQAAHEGSIPFTRSTPGWANRSDALAIISIKLACLLLPKAPVKSAPLCALAIIAGLTISDNAALAKKPKVPKLDATFVSQSVPASMLTGQTYSVSVTMQNTGSKSWTTSQFQLGSQNPPSNNTLGLTSISLSGNIVRGGSN